MDYLYQINIQINKYIQTDIPYFSFKGFRVEMDDGYRGSNG